MNITATRPLEATFTGTAWNVSEDSCTVYKVPTAYATIADAIAAINAAGPGSSVILLCPGAYVESFTLPRNTFVVSTAPTHRAGVRIVGHIVISAGGGRSGFSGVQLSGTNPALPVVDGSATVHSVDFHYCNVSSAIGATAATIVMSGGNLTGTFTNFGGEPTNAAIQLSGSAGTRLEQCSLSGTGVGLRASNTVNVFLEYVNVETNSSIELNDTAGARLYHCTFNGTGTNVVIVLNDTSTMQVTHTSFEESSAADIGTGTGTITYGALVSIPPNPTTFGTLTTVSVPLVP